MRRRGEQDGDRFRTQGPGKIRRRERGQQHRGRAGGQREVKAVEAVEVSERSGGENPVRCVDAVFGHTEPGVSEDALVGERHALGCGRGTRGIEQQERVGGDRTVCQIVRRGAIQIGERAGSVRSVAQDDDMLERREAASQVESCLRGSEVPLFVEPDERASPGMVQHGFHLGGAVGNVEGRHDSADRADREITHEILRPVGQLHRNHIAGAEAERLQSSGQSRHPPGKLTVGETPARIDDRRRIRRLGHRPREPLGEGVGRRPPPSFQIESGAVAVETHRIAEIHGSLAVASTFLVGSEPLGAEPAAAAELEQPLVVVAADPAAFLQIADEGHLVTRQADAFRDLGVRQARSAR